MDAVQKAPVVEAYKRDLDLSPLRKNLQLSPEERVLAAIELAKLAREARAAGERSRKRRRTCAHGCDGPDGSDGSSDRSGQFDR